MRALYQQFVAFVEMHVRLVHYQRPHPQVLVQIEQGAIPGRDVGEAKIGIRAGVRIFLLREVRVPA